MRVSVLCTKVLVCAHDQKNDGWERNKEERRKNISLKEENKVIAILHISFSRQFTAAYEQYK